MRAVLLVILVFVLVVAPQAAAGPVIRTAKEVPGEVIAVDDPRDGPPAYPSARTFVEDCPHDPVICAIQSLPVDEWLKQRMIASYQHAQEVLCVDDAQMSIGTSAARPGCWYVVERGELNLDPPQEEA